MAKKGFQVTRPNHEEYVENFRALTNGLIDQPREIVFKQVDHLLDKHALDYPWILQDIIVRRFQEEVIADLGRVAV